jgi:hypothetical protein
MRCNLVSTLLANRTSLIGFDRLFFFLISGWLVSSFSLLFFNLGERRRVVLLWNLGDRLGDVFAVFMGVIIETNQTNSHVLDLDERLLSYVRSSKWKSRKASTWNCFLSICSSKISPREHSTTIFSGFMPTGGDGVGEGLDQAEATPSQSSHISVRVLSRQAWHWLNKVTVEQGNLRQIYALKCKKTSLIEDTKPPAMSLLMGIAQN